MEQNNSQVQKKFPNQRLGNHQLPALLFSSVRTKRGFLGFSVGPFGDREMDLLTGEGFGFVRLFEAIPHQVSAYVGVGYVSHSRRPPKGNRCVRRHLSITSLSSPSLTHWCCSLQPRFPYPFSMCMYRRPESSLGPGFESQMGLDSRTISAIIEPKNMRLWVGSSTSN